MDKFGSPLKETTSSKTLMRNAEQLSSEEMGRSLNKKGEALAAQGRRKERFGAQKQEVIN